MVAREVLQLMTDPGSAASHPFADYVRRTISGRADQYGAIGMDFDTQGFARIDTPHDVRNRFVAVLKTQQLRHTTIRCFARAIVFAMIESISSVESGICFFPF